MTTTYTAATLTIQHDATETQAVIALLTALGVIYGLGNTEHYGGADEREDLGAAFVSNGPVG